MIDEDGDAILCDKCGEQVGPDAIAVYDDDGDGSVWFCVDCYVGPIDDRQEENNDIPF